MSAKNKVEFNVDTAEPTVPKKCACCSYRQIKRKNGRNLSVYLCDNCGETICVNCILNKACLLCRLSPT